MHAQPYQILLYYFFIPVEDPERVRAEQEEFCTAHHLLGRILVAGEGINGTVSGKAEDTQAYMDWMQNHPLFKGIMFKTDAAPHHAFNKLHVRVKNEIVHLGAEHSQPSVHPNNYVEPEEWREMLKQEDPDRVILDVRSDYEWKLGKFKDAVTLDIHNFRELPDKMDELEALKGKKIYTYCTGGIKCEKVSAWLKDKGFENVYQLHGGIIRYGHEAGGEDFEGSCYVFDQRVAVPVNHVNPTVISHCEACGKNETGRYINCANPHCNKHFLICESCAESLEGCCSEACHQHPDRRQYDGTGYYLRGVNSKLYVTHPDPNYLRNLKKEGR